MPTVNTKPYQKTNSTTKENTLHNIYLVRADVINATAAQWTLLNAIIIDGALSASPEYAHKEIGLFDALTAECNADEKSFFDKLYQCHLEQYSRFAAQPKAKDPDALRNCPFCNSRPYKPTQAKKNKSWTACANSRCEIFGIHIPVKAWQNNERFAG